jgi:hypothetical protein
MCGPGGGLWVMWWVHAGAVHGLHGQRGIAVEAIVVLDGRLVVRVVGGTVMPRRAVVIKVILVVVVLLVVHLRLAHGAARLGARWSGGSVRGRRSSPCQTVRSAGRVAGICSVVLLYLGAWVTSVRARACMHEAMFWILKRNSSGEDADAPQQDGARADKRRCGMTGAQGE